MQYGPHLYFPALSVISQNAYLMEEWSLLGPAVYLRCNVDAFREGGYSKPTWPHYSGRLKGG